MEGIRDNLRKERMETVKKIELKYMEYYQSLMEQKNIIIRKVHKQFDRRLADINQEIYKKIHLNAKERNNHKQQRKIIVNDSMLNIIENKTENISENNTENSESHPCTQSLVGQPIKVYWALDEQYYHGIIDKIDNNKTKSVHVKYDERDSEWIDFKQTKYQIINHQKINRNNIETKKRHKRIKNQI